MGRMASRCVVAERRTGSHSVTAPTSESGLRMSVVRTTRLTVSWTTEAQRSLCISTAFSARHRSAAPGHCHWSSARARSLGSSRIRQTRTPSSRSSDAAHQARFDTHNTASPDKVTWGPQAFVSHETAPMRFEVSIWMSTTGARVPRVSALPSVAAVHRRTSLSATVRTARSSFRTRPTEIVRSLCRRRRTRSARRTDMEPRCTLGSSHAGNVL